MTKREQTRGEEIANAVTHVVGSHLGAAMLALLVWQGVRSGGASRDGVPAEVHALPALPRRLPDGRGAA